MRAASEPVSTKPLSGLLGVTAGQTVSIVGCGGKTSLLLRLGAEWRERRVLLSTTTKIGRRETVGCDFFYDTPETWRNPSPQPGIHVAVAACGRKLSALPEDALADVRRGYSLTVLECDGSRRLPLKGWRTDEPVIPDYTSVTVGVAVVWPLGMPVSEDIVFQPELFYRISGALPGDALTPDHLANAIAHPLGLFQHARGRRVLLINQLDSAEQLQAARQVVARLPAEFTQGLDRILAGSLRHGSFTVLKTAGDAAGHP